MSKYGKNVFFTIDLWVHIRIILNRCIIMVFKLPATEFLDQIKWTCALMWYSSVVVTCNYSSASLEKEFQSDVGLTTVEGNSLPIV